MVPYTVMVVPQVLHTQETPVRPVASLGQVVAGAAVLQLALAELLEEVAGVREG
jgi:hypothetical protein